MKKKKFRIMITTTIEYEVNPKYYPNCETLYDMLAADIKNAENDPFLMMEMGEATTVVRGEIIED